VPLSQRFVNWKSVCPKLASGKSIFGSFTLNFYASGADKLLSPTKGRAP
jgi:hypothetical protein